MNTGQECRKLLVTLPCEVMARYFHLDVIIYQEKVWSRTMTKRACKYGRKKWSSRSEHLVSWLTRVRGR